MTAIVSHATCCPLSYVNKLALKASDAECDVGSSMYFGSCIIFANLEYFCYQYIIDHVYTSHCVPSHRMRGMASSAVSAFSQADKVGSHVASACRRYCTDATRM